MDSHKICRLLLDIKFQLQIEFIFCANFYLYFPIKWRPRHIFVHTNIKSFSNISILHLTSVVLEYLPTVLGFRIFLLKLCIFLVIINYCYNVSLVRLVPSPLIIFFQHLLYFALLRLWFTNDV